MNSRMRIMMNRSLIATGVLMVLALPIFAESEGELPSIVMEDFEQGADKWEPTDATAWKIVDTDKGKSFSLFKQSEYNPPHRSPLNIALLSGLNAGEFILDVDLKSTTEDYGHRSLCLFFGYQDAAHFYYVHLGKKTDDHANQIFIVNEAPRTKISTKTTPGTPWDDRWHHVRIVRNTESGSIAVYFDDMAEPIMTATDKTFSWGRIGLGSFDDTGDFDNVKIRGRKADQN